MHLMKWSLARHLLIPGIRRQGLIRSTARPSYTRAKILAYPLTMRLGGPQRGSRLFRMRKSSCLCRKSNKDCWVAHAETTAVLF